MKIGTIVRRKKKAIGYRLWPEYAPDIIWRVDKKDKEGYIYVYDKDGNPPNPRRKFYRWRPENFHIIQEP